MNIKQKILRCILALAVLVTSMNVWGTTVKAEENYDDCWELQELSYYNNNGQLNFDNKDGKTIISDTKSINNKVTWITKDGNYKITMTANGNTVTLNSFAYQGDYKGVDDLVLPTSFKLEYYNGVEEIKEEGKTVGYKYNKAESSVTLMSIGTAFNSQYVVTSTNTYLDLTLPVGVTSIDVNAFAGNTKLRSIIFGNAIQTISEGAFNGCNNLKNIDLANLYSHINTIPKNCFSGCNVLEVASIPSTVQNIGENAFYQCNAIDNLILGDNIKTVGKNAFAMCSNLRYIYITSGYQDWANIVDVSEKSKLITEKVVDAPIVASNGNTSSVGSNLFSTQRINVFGKIDLKDIAVTCNGVSVPVTAYVDTTYGYKTNAYKFTASTKGTYTVTATDILDNMVTKTFKYEKDVNDVTAPTLSISGQGSNDYYNSATIKVTENESYLGSVVVDGKPVKLSLDQMTYTTKITDEGEHTIVVADLFGNTTTKTFVIDATFPKVEGLENNAVYTSSKTLKFSDKVGIKYSTLNGKDIITGTKVEASGTYKLIVCDYADNKVEYNFTIGLDNPTIEGIENNAYANSDVRLSFYCVGGIKSVEDNFNGVTRNLTTESAVITGEGKHQITVKGYNGKSSKISFTIDTTAPTIESNSGKSKYIKNLTSQLTVSDKNLDTVMVNDVTFKGTTIKLDKENTYNIVVTDKAGNVKTVTYYVDMTAPKIKGVKANKTYKKAVTVKFSDKSGIKKVTVNKKKLSASQIKKGYKIKKKGKYTIKVWDKAGNTKTIKFTIKKKK